MCAQYEAAPDGPLYSLIIAGHQPLPTSTRTKHDTQSLDLRCIGIQTNEYNTRPAWKLQSKCKRNALTIRGTNCLMSQQRIWVWTLKLSKITHIVSAKRTIRSVFSNSWTRMGVTVPIYCEHIRYNPTLVFAHNEIAIELSSRDTTRD